MAEASENQPKQSGEAEPSAKLATRRQSKFARTKLDAKTPARVQLAPQKIFDEYSWDLTPVHERAIVAEFVAMTLFVWVGCGTVVSSQAILGFNPDDTNDNTYLTAVAIAFGFGITVLVYTIAPISGGHINPAVTFAFVFLGDMKPLMGLYYVLSQCLGALLGAALVWGTTASDTLTELNGVDAPPFLLGTNIVNPNLPLGCAFLGECIGTFLLVWTVMMTVVYKKNIAGNLAPIAIGWSVLLAHLVLVPLTGCGINPARSLGPMLVVIFAGNKVGFAGWWVFYTAPFVGSLVAALVAKYLFGVLHDEGGWLGDEPAKEPVEVFQEAEAEQGEHEE